MRSAPSILSLRPKDQARFEDLVNSSIQNEASSLLYTADYPIWTGIQQTFKKEMIGAYDGDVLMGGAGLAIRTVRTNHGSFRVGIVGAVCTHPKHRGRGVASNVLAEIMKRARAENVSALVLWGGESSIYHKLGFELMGEQINLLLNDVKKELSILPEASEVRRGWDLKIFKCMQERSFGFDLGEVTPAWIQSHRNVKWVWLEDTSGVTAYAAIGRGLDLKNVIHEWGGEAAKLKSLLALIYRDNPQARMFGPKTEFQRLELTFDDQNLEYLCQGLVLDPNQVVSAFGIGEFWKFTEPTSGQWVLTHKTGYQLKLEQRDLGKFLFNEPGICLPLYFWGLDSA